MTTLAVKKAIATERAIQKGSKELFSIQIAAQNELLYGKKFVFGKNSDSKTDQAEDNLSTVSCTAIALPTITLAKVVTPLAHRGESKNICVTFCYRL